MTVQTYLDCGCAIRERGKLIARSSEEVLQ